MNKQLAGWSAEDTVQFYTENRQSYDELYDSERYFLTKEFITQMFSVLDVGCATGGFYNVFEMLNPDIQYVGIDVSQELLKIAKSKFPSKVNPLFAWYNGEEEFPIKEKFDLVFSSGIMHLIDGWKELFRRMVVRCRKNVLADFRVTLDKTHAGTYVFDFDGDGIYNHQTNYHVVNLNELLDFFNSFRNISEISLFGYKGRANKDTVGVNEDIYMVFFKFQIGYRKTSNVKVIEVPSVMKKHMNRSYTLL